MPSVLSRTVSLTSLGHMNTGMRVCGMPLVLLGGWS